MKIAILAALTVLATPALFADRAALIEYDDQWNLFSKFEVSSTELDQDTAMLGGLKIGGLINNHVGIGLAANMLLNSVDFESGRYQPVENNDFYYGGGYLEYVFSPDSLVYVSVDTIIGGGHLSLTRTSGIDESVSMFVAEPGLNVMVNITETFMFGLGVSYRFVENVDLEDLDNGDLSGVTGKVFLRFTQF